MKNLEGLPYVFHQIYVLKMSKKTLSRRMTDKKEDLFWPSRYATTAMRAADADAGPPFLTGIN